MSPKEARVWPDQRRLARAATARNEQRLVVPADDSGMNEETVARDVGRHQVRIPFKGRE
jgi:hypothetical protein